MIRMIFALTTLIILPILLVQQPEQSLFVEPQAAVYQMELAAQLHTLPTVLLLAPVQLVSLPMSEFGDM